MVLDSAHVVPRRTQVPWIHQQFLPGGAMAKGRAKIVAYHMPLYSPQDLGGCRHGQTQHMFKRPRQVWGSVFDQYNVSVVLEHHTHLLKRSKPLRAQQVANSTRRGTVYLGGGAWGVAPTKRWTRCSTSATAGAHGWSIEHAELENNVWHGVVSARALRMTALGTAGRVLDNVTIPI